MTNIHREGKFVLNRYLKSPFQLQNLFSVETFFVLFLFSGFLDGFVPIGNPYLIFLFMALTVISSAVVLWRRQTVRSEQVILAVLWLIFVAYAFTSLLWVPAENYSVGKSIRLVITTLSLLIPTIVISPDPKRRSRFAVAILGFSFFTGLLMVWFIVTSGSFSNLQAFGSSYQLNSRILGFGFLISTYSYIFEREYYGTITGLGVGFFGLLLLGAGGRAPLVAATLTVPIFLLAHLFRIDGSEHRKRYGKVVVVAIIGIAGFIYVLDRIGFGVRTLNRLLISIASGSIVEHRVMYYPTAIETWLENPILGIGFGGWPAVWEASNDHPHNIVLEVLSELGLVGLVLFFATVGYALAKLRPISRAIHTPAAVLFIGLFVYGVLITLVSGDINSDRFTFAIMGVLIAVND